MGNLFKKQASKSKQLKSPNVNKTKYNNDKDNLNHHYLVFVSKCDIMIYMDIQYMANGFFIPNHVRFFQAGTSASYKEKNLFNANVLDYYFGIISN